MLTIFTAAMTIVNIQLVLNYLPPSLSPSLPPFLFHLPPSFPFSFPSLPPFLFLLLCFGVCVVCVWKGEGCVWMRQEAWLHINFCTYSKLFVVVIFIRGHHYTAKMKSMKPCFGNQIIMDPYCYYQEDFETIYNTPMDHLPHQSHDKPSQKLVGRYTHGDHKSIEEYMNRQVPCEKESCLAQLKGNQASSKPLPFHVRCTAQTHFHVNISAHVLPLPQNY